jgi:hypothetical protein
MMQSFTCADASGRARDHNHFAAQFVRHAARFPMLVGIYLSPQICFSL